MRIAVILVALVILLFARTASAAEVVVIDSTAAAYPEGTMIDAEAAIRLAPGERVTLVSGTGAVRSLEGPHDGPALPAGAARDDPTLLDALAKLVRDGGAEKAAGVVRGMEKGHPPDPSWIDVSRAGTYCVAEVGPAILWRPDARREDALSILAPGRAAPVKLPWPAAAETLRWPAEVPVEDGATYRLRQMSRLLAKRIRLNLVPPNLASPAHRVAWMARNGCARQARRLIGTLH